MRLTNDDKQWIQVLTREIRDTVHVLVKRPEALGHLQVLLDDTRALYEYVEALAKDHGVSVNECEKCGEELHIRMSGAGTFCPNCESKEDRAAERGEEMRDG